MRTALLDFLLGIYYLTADNMSTVLAKPLDPSSFAIRPSPNHLRSP